MPYPREPPTSSGAPSLWNAVAPTSFQMGEDGRILFSKDVRTLIIDVGARDSDYLATLETIKDPSIALILVDPLPDSMIPLIRRVADYSMLDMKDKWLNTEKRQVYTVKAALGTEEGVTNFNVADGPACGSLLEPDPNSTFWCTKVKQKLQVAVLTLEGLLRLVPDQIESYHLKVDAEGADLLVLQGAKDSIRRFQTVVIECGDDVIALRTGECQKSAAMEYMSKYSFATEWQQQGGLGNAFFLNRNISDPLPNLLVHEKSRLAFGNWYREKNAQLKVNNGVNGR